jgi:hypothetical protein
MSELSTRDLFTQLQSKLIIDIKENEIVCPNCKGLRFVLIEKSDKGYIESCQRCYAGKVNICKHCGNDSKLSCQCGQSRRERDTIYCSAQAQKELDAYNQAEKISFNDYNGKFLLESDDYAKDKDDIEEWINEHYEGEFNSDTDLAYHYVEQLGGVKELGENMRCRQVIISGGIKTFLDGYYLTQKSELPAVYGQAAGFLLYARDSYEHVRIHLGNSFR